MKDRDSGKYTFFVENDRRQKLYKVYAAGAFRGKTLELLLYPVLVENQPFIEAIVKTNSLEYERNRFIESWAMIYATIHCPL